jgi:hypothetical protein
MRVSEEAEDVGLGIFFCLFFYFFRMTERLKMCGSLQKKE